MSLFPTSPFPTPAMATGRRPADRTGSPDRSPAPSLLLDPANTTPAFGSNSTTAVGDRRRDQRGALPVRFASRRFTMAPLSAAITHINCSADYNYRIGPARCVGPALRPTPPLSDRCSPFRCSVRGTAVAERTDETRESRYPGQPSSRGIQAGLRVAMFGTTSLGRSATGEASSHGRLETPLAVTFENRRAPRFPMRSITRFRPRQPPGSIPGRGRPTAVAESATVPLLDGLREPPRA